MKIYFIKFMAGNLFGVFPVIVPIFATDKSDALHIAQTYERNLGFYVKSIVSVLTFTGDEKIDTEEDDQR